MSEPSCSARISALIPRLGELYARRAADRIYATFSIPHPSPALEAFRAAHPAGACSYPDPAERIAFWADLLAERPAVVDDALPGCYLTEMDQGVYGGVLGGAVRWECNPDTGWISSMVSPLLERAEQIPALQFDPRHPFFRRYLRQVETFVRGAQGRFGVCSLMVIDGLNMLFEMLGATDGYTVCLEQPELAEAGIELGYSVASAIQDAFFARVPLIEDGTCSLYFGWLSGRVVMTSVDPFHMASVAFFERWGRAPLERTLARYDGGELHLHGNGRHLLEAVASVKGLVALILGDDTGYPPAFEVLPELRRRSGDLPLAVYADYGAFVAALDAHTLPGGVLYHVRGAPDTDSANRIMERVRAYRL